MSTSVPAKFGDTLCSIAMAGGFLDCAPVRALPENAPLLNRDLANGDIVTVPDITIKEETRASEKRYTFQLKTAPPILLRFVHGSPDKPYREDLDINVLEISNFPTDKAGKNVKQTFPAKTTFDQLGHDDIDTFKMEVVDPAGPASVDVKLQALQPVYGVDGKVASHKEFAGAELARRSQTVKTEKVKSAVCYRSPYLRLVVDQPDKDSRPAQTLLITDLTTDAGGDDDKVEILDQRVRAAYERVTCPGSPKCRALAELPVGSDKKRVKLALHILKDPVTGAALSTDRQVRRTLLMFMRQVYAQADLSIKILGKAREIVAPSNMVVVDNLEGRRAAGAGSVQVRVEITDLAFDQTVSITTTANATCTETAAALAAAIRAVVPSGITVRDFPNPAAFGKTRGSADVVVGDPLVNTIRLTVVTSGDTRQPVRAAAMVNAQIDAATGNERNVGSVQTRLIINNYDSGRDRVDVFIFGNTPGLLGLGLNSWSKYGKVKYGHDPSRNEFANSFLVAAGTLHTTGAAENFYTTIPHEIGHVLMDAVHALNRPTELMGPGSPVGANERVVNGPKRITGDHKIPFDDAITDTPVTMFRDNTPELFTTFDDVSPSITP